MQLTMPSSHSTSGTMGMQYVKNRRFTVRRGMKGVNSSTTGIRPIRYSSTVNRVRSVYLRGGTEEGVRGRGWRGRGRGGAGMVGGVGWKHRQV